MVNRNITKCEECRWLDTSRAVTWGGQYKCMANHGNKYKCDNATRCPDREKYQKPSSWSRSGWYITSLIFNILGDSLDNSSIYLNLYYLKDNYLNDNDTFKNFLIEYEQIAPLVTESILNDPNCFQLARSLEERFLKPCSLLVDNANFFEATLAYINMFEELKDHYKIELVRPKVLKRVRIKNNETN